MLSIKILNVLILRGQEIYVFGISYCQYSGGKILLVPNYRHVNSPVHHFPYLPNSHRSSSPQISLVSFSPSVAIGVLWAKVPLKQQLAEKGTMGT